MAWILNQTLTVPHSLNDHYEIGFLFVIKLIKYGKESELSVRQLFHLLTCNALNKMHITKVKI